MLLLICLLSALLSSSNKEDILPAATKSSLDDSSLVESPSFQRSSQPSRRKAVSLGLSNDPFSVDPEADIISSVKTYLTAANKTNRALLKEQAQRLWENDRKGFLSKIQSLSEPYESSLLLTLIFEDLVSANDITSHLMWIRSFNIEGDPDLKTQKAALQALVDISRNSDRMDKQGFEQIASEVTSRFDNTEYHSLLPSFGESYAHYFPERVEELFEKMPSSPITEQALIRIMSVLGEQSAEHGLQLLDSESAFSACFFLNDKDSLLFESELGSGNVERQQKVNDSLIRAMNDVRDKATEAFLNGLARQDAIEALQELNRIKDRKMRIRLSNRYWQRLQYQQRQADPYKK